MGATYGSISVNAPNRDVLLGWLREKGIAAFVGQSEGGWLAFSDERTDGQDIQWVQSLVRRLTQDLQCVAIVVAVYDEEQLYLLVAKDGQLKSRYRSCPGMEMDDPGENDMRPQIEDAPAFVRALGGTIELDALLGALKIDSEEDYVHPIDLHEQITAFLKLPKYSVGFGYNYTIQDEVNLEEAGLTRI